MTVRMTGSTRKERLTQCLPGVDQRDRVRTPRSPEATESSGLGQNRAVPLLWGNKQPQRLGFAASRAGPFRSVCCSVLTPSHALPQLCKRHTRTPRDNRAGSGRRTQPWM